MVLNNDTFELFAANHYDNPGCVSKQEFLEDLCRFRYVKRLCARYRESGEIKDRLILNHLVVLYNLFGSSCTAMLLLKIPQEDWGTIVPFIEALGFLPYYVRELSPVVETEKIIRDERVQDAINNIFAT